MPAIRSVILREYDPRNNKKERPMKKKQKTVLAVQINRQRKENQRIRKEKRNAIRANPWNILHEYDAGNNKKEQ